MHLTDIEERAIQQLEQYYLSLYEEGEVAISVRRLPRIDEHDLLKQKTPNWSKSYKQKLCPSKK
jgi:hypothetical protein